MVEKNYPNHNRQQVLGLFEAGEIDITTAFNLLLGNNGKEKATKDSRPDEEERIEAVEKQVARLNRLIGLQKIKDIVHEFRALLAIQKKRKELGLKTESVVMHMVFKGNPGTGKTTVARLLGKIYNEMGLLDKGHLKEVERADLVGEYIGQTAQKTRKVIKESLGGILFIDEAYSLARGGERDFGKEAIDALVKAMEDHNDNLIIILDGYRQEMEDFLNTNPGLDSRLPIKIDFDDYSIDELMKIAELMTRERQYILDQRARKALFQLLLNKRIKEGYRGGNARTVRNIIEKTIRNQAVRLFNKEDHSRQDLLYLKKEDLEEDL